MALKPIARAAHALARPVFKNYGLSEGLIAENWPEIVGEEWAKGSAPRHYARQSRTLTVRVGGARALEFAHLERELISRINTFAGREIVSRIKIVQGPVASRSAERAKVAELSPAEAAEIERRAAGIGDSGLRAALIALGKAIKSR